MIPTMVTILLFALSFFPLMLCAKNTFRKKISKKIALAVNITSVFSLCILVFALSASSVVSAAEPDAVDAVETAATDNSTGLGLIAAALATGLSCVGAGIAVASSAAAACGAISENPKVFGQALIFVALAEGVALYGLIISLQILAKI